MSFPNSSRLSAILFWAIISIGLFLFGVTVIYYRELLGGSHPILIFAHKIAEMGFFKMVVYVVTTAIIGWLLVSTWVLLATLVFLVLSRFDRDIVGHLFIFSPPGDDWEVSLTGSQVNRILQKVALLAIITAPIVFTLITLLL